MKEFLLYIATGFVAEMVDGALGMAYGVISSTLLVAAGLPPAHASAGIHYAETFTCLASGYSHFRAGNIERRLFIVLASSGAAGALFGAIVAASVPARHLRPAVAFYLGLLGVRILVRALRPGLDGVGSGRPGFLGFFGGLMDSAGGGGWGPIVTSSLMAGGRRPRIAVGTANAAEFFVAAASSGMFLYLLGPGECLLVVGGLLVGGVAAAPAAAFLTGKIPPRLLMVLVGGGVIAASARTLYLSLTR